MKSFKKFLNVGTVFPVLLLIVGGYWLSLSKQLPVGTDPYMKNNTYPAFILILMMICCVVVIAQEVMKAAKAPAVEEKPLTEEEKKEARLKRMDEWKVVIMAVALAIYVLLLDTVGFIICTICLMLIAGILYGQKNKVLLIGVSVLFPIAMYLIFRFALKIMLPTLIL